MTSAFKRFLAGRKKVDGASALCIGDFNDVHVGRAESFKATRVPLAREQDRAGSRIFKEFWAKHLGKDHAGSPGKEHLQEFLKANLGFHDVAFFEGRFSKERVMHKLAKLFKSSHSSVVLVYYCGASDERGNWLVGGAVRSVSDVDGSGASEAWTANSLFGTTGPSMPGAIAASSSSCESPATSAPGSIVHAQVVSFREVSSLWQQHRRHSQRLILLLDCPASGVWVQALRSLSKAEQLELSLAVQASDCGPGAEDIADEHATATVHPPGAFTSAFIACNQMPRSSISSLSDPNLWAEGMHPSYYNTWLGDSLLDYGIPLSFVQSASAEQRMASNAMRATRMLTSPRMLIQGLIARQMSIEGTGWQSPPHTEASALRSQRATDQGLLAHTVLHPNPNALQMLSSHSGVSGVGGGLSTTSTGSQGIQLQQPKLANSRFSMDQGQVDHLALGLRSMSGAQTSSRWAGGQMNMGAGLSQESALAPLAMARYKLACGMRAIGLLSDPNHQGLDVNVSSHTAIDTTNLQCTMPQFEHTLEGAEGVTGQHKSHPSLLATAEVQAVRQSVLASRSVPASSLEPRQHRPLLPGSQVQPPLQEGHLQPDALPGKQADNHLQISLITSLPGHGTDGEHAPDTDIDSSCSAMLTPNATHGSRAAAAYKTQYDLGMVARCASESMAQTWASLAAFERQGYGRGMPHLVAAAKDGSQMGQQQQQPGGRLAGGTAQGDVLGAAVGDMPLPFSDELTERLDEIRQERRRAARRSVVVGEEEMQAVLHDAEGPEFTSMVSLPSVLLPRTNNFSGGDNSAAGQTDSASEVGIGFSGLGTGAAVDTPLDDSRVASAHGMLASAARGSAANGNAALAKAAGANSAEASEANSARHDPWVTRPAPPALHEVLSAVRKAQALQMAQGLDAESLNQSSGCQLQPECATAPTRTPGMPAGVPSSTCRLGEGPGMTHGSGVKLAMESCCEVPEGMLPSPWLLESYSGVTIDGTTACGAGPGMGHVGAPLPQLPWGSQAEGSDMMPGSRGSLSLPPLQVGSQQQSAAYNVTCQLPHTSQGCPSSVSGSAEGQEGGPYERSPSPPSPSGQPALIVITTRKGSHGGVPYLRSPLSRQQTFSHSVRAECDAIDASGSACFGTPIAASRLHMTSYAGVEEQTSPCALAIAAASGSVGHTRQLHHSTSMGSLNGPRSADVGRQLQVSYSTGPERASGGCFQERAFHQGISRMPGLSPNGPRRLLSSSMSGDSPAAVHMHSLAVASSSTGHGMLQPRASRPMPRHVSLSGALHRAALARQYSMLDASEAGTGISDVDSLCPTPDGTRKPVRFEIAGSETSSFLFNEMHDHQAMMAHLHSYEAAAAAEAEAEAAPREASSNGAMPHGADSGAYVSMQCRGTSAARCVLMADAGQALSADVDGQAEDYLDPTYISHGLTADVDSPRNSMPQLRLSPAANPTILLRRLKAAAMLAADKDTSTDSTGITNAGPEARSSFELNPAAQANNQMVSEAMMLPSLQAAEGKQSTAVAVAGSGNSNACHLGKPSTRGLVQRASFEL